MAKKLVKSLLFFVLILLLTFPFWLKSVPTKYLSFLFGRLKVVDRVVCTFSTQVAGESMNPLISPGSSLELNRCFKEEDLVEGTVVLFSDGQNQRLGIIRHILLLDPVLYKISDEKASDLFHDVIKEEITAVNNSIDVSKSKYKAKQVTESFVFDANDYLSDLYLGRIPRGYGVEMVTVEKTTTFIKDQDKFCSVIVPKKDLMSVDIEIINANTKKVVRKSEGIVFKVRPQPNIGCEDFGSTQGFLDLESGIYRYRFLLNHQVLSDIQFEVK